MPFAEHFMLQGTFTVPATVPAVANVNTGFLPTKVELINMSAITSMTGGPPPVNPGANYLMYRAVWNSSFASAAIPFTLVEGITPSAATSSITPITSNGIGLYDGTKSVLLGPVITGGALSKANPAQLTSTAHGLQTGDQILIHGPFTAATAMNQLGGIIFTVTVTGANTVTIPINTNTANFTATTVTTWQKVIVGPLYYPQRTVITGITAANPIVVTTATNHGFTVGQQVRLRVPSALGMVQANNLQGVITAVTSTTFTIGSIDSSAFTAFAWPAVTSLPFTPATVTPIGSGPSAVATPPFYNVDVLDDATTNVQFQGFTVGTGILATPSSTVFGVTAGDVISWTAWRADL
jgi:hypothetical protein